MKKKISEIINQYIAADVQVNIGFKANSLADSIGILIMILITKNVYN